MRRFWLLSILVLPQVGQTQDAQSPALEEARLLMTEGLERDLPAPVLRGPPQWPLVDGKRPAPREERVGPKLDALGERVRNEASVRARALAEERRAQPDNQPGVGQSRTRAAKGMGPNKPKPPRP